MDLVRCPSRVPASVLKQLTGLTVAQYSALLVELGPRWAEARYERLSARERRRELGGGRKPFPFAGRLLLALVNRPSIRGGS